MKHRKNLTAHLPLLLAAAVGLLLLLWFFSAVGQLTQSQAEEGRQQLETSLRRAAVACYAAEGIYPPTLEYLTDHYGVQIDTNRYWVFYEIAGENLMPDITVLEKENGTQ